jgi:exodeoxyribonuclease VII large subunit
LAKLQTEGLFDDSRKRPLPYPPTSVGLITSKESAAYADFIKVLAARWGGIEIQLADVQVQGEAAGSQIIRAIEWFNTQGNPPEVLVIIRGGGSAEDLQTFNTEGITRAVAASRIPVLAAIGHEVDLSLVELAADLRASTPSNAAELLVPDRRSLLSELHKLKETVRQGLDYRIKEQSRETAQYKAELTEMIGQIVSTKRDWLKQTAKILEIINPKHVLSRGYSVVRKNGQTIRSLKMIRPNDRLDITLSDGTFRAEVK